MSSDKHFSFSSRYLPVLLIILLPWAVTNKAQAWKWLLCKAIALCTWDLTACYKDLPNSSYRVEILDLSNPQMLWGVLNKQLSLMQILFMTRNWFGRNIFVFWIIFHWSQWASIEKGEHYYESSKDFLKSWVCITLAQVIKTHYWCDSLLLKLHF